MARRRRGVVAAIQWTLLAVVLHVAGISFYMWVMSLLPERTLAEAPREVEVTWVEAPEPSQEINLPEALPEVNPTPTEARALPPPVETPPEPTPSPEKPLPKPPELAKVKPPEPKQAEPPKPKPPEKQKVPELALIPQVKPPPPPPTPPPPKEEQKQKVQPPKERHKAVEVDDDQHVVNEPPPEAAYLSDKNRRVQEQTRDTRTNLEKTSKGEASASEKSDEKSAEEVGGAEQKVHQLEKAVASSLEKKNLPPTEHNGRKDEATGVLSGTKGQAGKGEGGNRGEGGQPGALSMRNVEGRGAPGGLPDMSVAPAGANDDAPAVALSQAPGGGGPSGRPGREGKAGKPGERGPKLQLTMDDYQRIVGQDKIDDEAQLAQRQLSHKKGRWEKKMEQIHASLENFTPEVKPGNQTALGTRAAPFAVFIARMHRKIHELWGFGFLEDLDGKSSSNPMNDRKLEVMLEIVLNGDGTLEKATIVKPSGVLTFDVAAIDTVQNAGPFENPPESIRSGNGKVYLHWTFHRDERQCSPYFADPFILDNAGTGQEAGNHVLDPAEAMAKQRQAQRISRKSGPTEGGVIVPHVSRTPDQEAAAARATVNMATADDPIANAVALSWANAFNAGRVADLVALSGVPFSSGGSVVATDPGGLAKVWTNVLGEMPSRHIQEWKLFSAAGYRAVFGRLPKGGEDGTSRLYLAVRVGKEWLTLDVVQDAQGQFQVKGLTR